MSTQTWEARRIHIKLTECSVMDAIDDYQPETLTDCDECKDGIQAATIPYNQLRDLINATLIRPPPGADEDVIDQLREEKETTRRIFVEHKRSLQLRVS